MKNLLLSGMCCAGLMALLPSTASAHGGQYRGPGDVVPPGGGGGGGRTGGPAGPTTGGPAGPSAPAPTAPTTGGPAGPTTGGPAGPAGGAGPTTGGPQGIPITSDLTRWTFWWEFNKDPFIRLRDAIHASGPQTGSDDFYLGSTKKSEAKDSLRPTSDEIMSDVLPALKKAIDGTDQRDINSSCMVAMAKIGKDHTEFKLVDVFRPRLAKGDQEIREVAALAIGIAAIAGEDEMNLLIDLALDKGKGREASDGSVNARTRAFSLYGLGLISHATTNVEIKRKAFTAMKTVLEDKSINFRDLKVAAINGMAILNIGMADDAAKTLLGDVLNSLEEYYMQKLGASEQLIQAHCPPAIAKLIGKDHPDVDRYKRLFADDLMEKGKVKRSSNEIAESCALALGQLCQPYDDKKSADKEYSELLLDTWHKHKDLQTKNFSMLGLGFIGGEENKKVVLKEFDKAGKTIEKPWCALALGVYSHRIYEQQKAASGAIDPESFIGETLYKELKDCKSPDLTGALAIGLGLNRYTDAADKLRELMKENQAKEDMAGYCAIGLALMNDTRSIEDIREVVDGASRRFSLLQQAAIALGKLGDKGVADLLQKKLTDGEPNLAKLSAIASAIGFIGDKRTIKPLKDLLFDTKLGDLSRAFAAVALGGVSDKENLPWNSKISSNMNYRAAVETLTNQQSGILDIL
ncbi:MAG: HEAT repeat domain-containing protein [Planctomycetes bacterium]|nr:HEAT repeat domain-containing protein [Planctomycetota bacterium]